jgi:hypothetical protein
MRAEVDPDSRVTTGRAWNTELPADTIVAAPPPAADVSVPATEPPTTEPPTGAAQACTTAVCRDVADAIRKMSGFADGMCAFRGKGMPCVERLTAEMVQYGDLLAKKYEGQEGQPEPPVTDAQKQAMESAMARLSVCVAEATGD